MRILHAVADFHAAAHGRSPEQDNLLSMAAFGESRCRPSGCPALPDRRLECQDVVGQYCLIRVNLAGHPASHMCGTGPQR
jgi:hypothetical protein